MNIVGTNSIRHAGATTARPWSSLDDPSVGGCTFAKLFEDRNRIFEGDEDGGWFDRS